MSEQKDILEMSSFELDPRRQNSGANNRYENKKVAEVDNVIDYMPAKPPAESTYKTHIRELGKRILQTAKTVPIYNNFDRLKICIDLRLHNKLIEFEIVSMHNMKHPDKHVSYVKEQIVTNRYMKVAFSGNPENNVEFDEDDFLEDYDLEDTDEPLPKRTGKNVYENCGIPQKLLPTGLNAIYIKDDYFIIDITGKWMADEGYLGYINAHNIAQALNGVRDLKYVYFNVAKALDIATIRLCDVTLDIETIKQRELIAGVSVISPTLKPSYETYNYKNGGLIIRGTAIKTGMSFSMYDKGRELDDRRHNYYSYLNVIGAKGLEKAHKTLRLEAHLWRLKDIREILEIPEKEAYEVSLHDVILSKTPAILNVMKKYKLTEEILLDEIKGFTDEYLTSPQTETDIMELLAGIGAMVILSKQAGMYRATKDFIAKEFMLEDDERLMQKLSRSMHNAFYNFILYFRPKSIKSVLDLLDLIHKVYGRSFDEVGEDEKEAA